jgi:LPS sulfotransferase NodH
MKPKKSFIIWFTPRTGSTLLCKGLEMTGIAGKAGEFFNISEQDTLTHHYHVKNYQELKEKLWKTGSSKNGVLGVKYSLYKTSYDKLAREIQQMRDLQSLNPLDWQLWEDLFPDCKHIYLTRRNKIRLAVSWWKAIQDEQWHRKTGTPETATADFYRAKYNFDALMHLLKECNLREAAIQAFYDHNQIRPLTIIYEDFVQNYAETITSILDYLDIPFKNLTVKPPYFEKMANHFSEKWVQRFRADLQDGWERPMW